MPYEQYWSRKAAALIHPYEPARRVELRKFFEARVLHYFSKKGGSCSTQEAERRACDDLEKVSGE